MVLLDFQRKHYELREIANLETGWSSTYQVFNFDFNQPGIVVFRQNGQNAIISNEQSVKLSLTRGDPEDAELIIVGKMNEVEISVNFSAVNDLLIREYHSVIIAFIVVNMLFLCASYVRQESYSSNFVLNFQIIKISTLF